MGGIAKSVGSAFVKGSAVAGTALAGLIGKSVSMAGDLEQQLGGTEAVLDNLQVKYKPKVKRHLVQWDYPQMTIWRLLIKWVH